MASYIVFKQNDGSFLSQTLWSNGVDSLLPEADTLVLGINPTAKNLLIVPWDPGLSITSRSDGARERSRPGPLSCPHIPWHKSN